MSEQADRAETFLRELQDRICGALEQLDGSARFVEDAWTRAAGGGGRTLAKTSSLSCRGIALPFNQFQAACTLTGAPVQ